MSLLKLFKLMLLLLVSCFSTNTKAQTFFPDSMQYFFNFMHTWGGDPEFILQSNILVFDSLNQGEEYYTLWDYRLRTYSNPRMISTRNDSVFGYENGNKFLKYDFTLEVGDSIILNCTERQDTVMAYVDSIEYRNFYGEIRKMIYLEESSMSCERYPILLGVGNFCQGIIQECGGFETGFDLLGVCIKDSSFEVTYPYKLVPTTKCTEWYQEINSVNDISKINIKISPNPVHGKLMVQGAKTEVDYKLMDQQGRQILIGKSADHIIDLNGISSGVYYLYLTYENQLYQSKIIVY